MPTPAIDWIATSELIKTKLIISENIIKNTQHSLFIIFYKKKIEKIMKSKIKNWRKKTAIYIGRFQPIHDGHLKIIIKAIKKNGQIAILVMDSYKINKKNPFTFNQVKKKIENKLSKYVNKYQIIKIPVVSEFIYGRKVGYKINKYKIGKKLEKISATKIRKGLKIG